MKYMYMREELDDAAQITRNEAPWSIEICCQDQSKQPLQETDNLSAHGMLLTTTLEILPPLIQFTSEYSLPRTHRHHHC